MMTNKFAAAALAVLMLNSSTTAVEGRKAFFVAKKNRVQNRVQNREEPDPLSTPSLLGKEFDPVFLLCQIGVDGNNKRTYFKLSK